MEIIIIQERQLIVDAQHGVGALSYQCLFRMVLTLTNLYPVCILMHLIGKRDREF